MSALVSLKSASKTFKSTTAFRDVDLNIGQGEFITLAGPNGSGKTTLLRCMLGITDFDSNKNQQILSHGLPVELDDRKQIFYIPDEDSLIDEITAKEYFGLVANAYGQNEKAISKAVRSLTSLDFDISKIDQAIKTYSHGMRKKVQICALFIPKAKFIIIDEPTNGLDPTAIILLKDLLQNLKSPRKTILISTHNLAFAEQIASRVLLMKNTIIFDNDIKSLLKKTKTKSLEAAYAKTLMKKQKVN